MLLTVTHNPIMLLAISLEHLNSCDGCTHMLESDMKDQFLLCRHVAKIFVKHLESEDNRLQWVIGHCALTHHQSGQISGICDWHCINPSCLHAL